MTNKRIITRNKGKDKNPTAGLSAIKNFIGIPAIIFCGIFMQISLSIQNSI